MLQDVEQIARRCTPGRVHVRGQIAHVRFETDDIAAVQQGYLYGAVGALLLRFGERHRTALDREALASDRLSGTRRLQHGKVQFQCASTEVTREIERLDND